MKRKWFKRFAFLVVFLSITFFMSSCDLLLLETVTTSSSEFPINELEAPQLTYSNYDKNFHWDAIDGATSYQIYVDNVLVSTTSDLMVYIDFNDYFISHIVGIRAIPLDFDLFSPSIIHSIPFVSPIDSHTQIWISDEPWGLNTIPSDMNGNCVYLFTPKYESDYHLSPVFVSAPVGWTALPLYWNNPDSQKPEQLTPNEDGTYDIHLYEDVTYVFVFYDVPDPMTVRLEVTYRFAYSEDNLDLITLEAEEKEVLTLDVEEFGYYVYVTEENADVILQAYDSWGNTLGGWSGYAFFEYTELNMSATKSYELHLWNPSDEAITFRILKLDMSERILSLNEEQPFQTTNQIEIFVIPKGFAGYLPSIKYIYFDFSNFHQSIEFITWQNYYAYPVGIQSSPGEGELLYELMIDCGHTTYIVIRPFNNFPPEYSGTATVTITLNEPF